MLLGELIKGFQVIYDVGLLLLSFYDYDWM